MCRLFGFRSVITSQVHRSLISAENALMRQSTAHPDGWGVAYYVDGYPHVVKSVASAVSDSLFRRVSGVVASETVIAHLRKATVGNLSILNSHPFQYGNWIFAHNGQIPDFETYREALMERVSPRYRGFILGDTDSEVIFYLLISQMVHHFDIHRRGTALNELVAAVEATVGQIHEVTGLNCYTEAGQKGGFYLTFLISNGRLMLAHQGGKELYYSTFKNRCPERASCPSFAPCCEQVARGDFVNHFLVSSEPLQGENVWMEMAPGEMAAVDWRMRLLTPAGEPRRATQTG